MLWVVLTWLGVYLTDLTFIEDGIPSIIKKSAAINFAKRAKTAEVIRDIQQYQNVPYPLQPVPELQEYILTNMQAAGDVHEMYEKSLAVEPREREDEKIVRYVRLIDISSTYGVYSVVWSHKEKLKKNPASLPTDAPWARNALTMLVEL